MVLFATACGSSSTDVPVPIAAPRSRVTPATAPGVTAATITAPTITAPVDLPGLDPDPESDRRPDATTPPGSAGAPAVPTATTPSSSTPPDSVDFANTLPPPGEAPRTRVDPTFGASDAAFERLARDNLGASMTVVSGGAIVYSRASGQTIDRQPATGDSPMVIASVSKIVVAIAIARLHDQGLVDVSAPFPWADVGLAPNAAWNDVTVRELLDHRGGLTTARSSWFTGEGTCRDYIPSLLTSAPEPTRGRWVYSNGNYCLLGLLVESRTGLALDRAVQQLVFDPVGASGVHLTDDGLQPGDLPHAPGVERLSRLGGAGNLIVSTDDMALLLGHLTPSDRFTLRPPGVFTDQYGFGHTGTIEAAKACVWLFDGGTTVVSATIAGSSIGSGGGVCDVVVPAVATDLGINQGPPVRTP